MPFTLLICADLWLVNANIHSLTLSLSLCAALAVLFSFHWVFFTACVINLGGSQVGLATNFTSFSCHSLLNVSHQKHVRDFFRVNCWEQFAEWNILLWLLFFLVSCMVLDCISFVLQLYSCFLVFWIFLLRKLFFHGETFKKTVILVVSVSCFSFATLSFLETVTVHLPCGFSM